MWSTRQHVNGTGGQTQGYFCIYEHLYTFARGGDDVRLRFNGLRSFNAYCTVELTELKIIMIAKRYTNIPIHINTRVAYLLCYEKSDFVQEMCLKVNLLSSVRVWRHNWRCSSQGARVIARLHNALEHRYRYQRYLRTSRPAVECAQTYGVLSEFNYAATKCTVQYDGGRMWLPVTYILRFYKLNNN